MSVHSLQKLAKNISNNRWTNEFTQGEKIGKGGFASVYQAKNHFDENDYAVKKIKLRVNKLKGNTQEELERILTESKFLARVNHHNVLRYYNSWLEIGTKRKEFAKPACNYGKNKGDWREIGSDEEEESEDISTYDSLGDVDSPAVVFDRSSLKESGDNDFIFECSQSTAEQFSKGFSFGYEEDMKPVPQNNHQKESAKDIDPILEALTASISEEETVEKIMLFIQTELCSESLGDYIASRNQKLASLQTKDQENYQKAWREYLKEAIAFAKQILAGLAHIHSHGIVHRDLKPQNIFLSNKVCKIGDFGLIKMSNASNSEASSHSKSEKSEDVIVPSEKSNSKSDKTKGKETPVGAVGTKTFASPEQWAGDDSKSDFKSDIFSLGVTLLLLFHPITTSMEELKVISDCKTGKLPSKLEKELPEIASIIKKMLAVDPCNRPSLKAISASLNVPVEIDTELTGNVVLRKEDSDAWESRHFKIIGKNFCVFKREQDKKAENIYVLPEWAVLLENASDCDNNAACITLEDPMRLGCTFRMENCEQTNQLFNQIQKYVQ